jgi:hypothetical protein
MGAAYILRVNSPVAFATVRGYLVARNIRTADGMASMAVNTYGGIPVSSRECLRMHSVKMLLRLFHVAGLALFAAFKLKFPVVFCCFWGMRIGRDAVMTCCATLGAVN